MNVFLNRSRTYGQSGIGYSGQSKRLTVTRILVRQGSISPAEKIPLYRGEVVRTRFFHNLAHKARPRATQSQISMGIGSIRSGPGSRAPQRW
jgi:hypothetical protein